MSKNAHLRTQVKALSTEVSLQGGAVLDGLGFTSEAQVRECVLHECPKGGAFKVFLDLVLLFCCNPDKPVPRWEKQTLTMDKSYSATAHKVVSFYYKTHCVWYTGGKKVILGKLLAAFKTSDGWKGVSGMDGRRQEIETSAATLAEIAHQWVANKLPSKGLLVPLALKMNDQPLG